MLGYGDMTLLQQVSKQAQIAKFKWHNIYQHRRNSN